MDTVTARRVALIVGALIVIWIGVVRYRTGDVRAWPSATPSTLHFDGRHFRRGLEQPVPDVDVERGHTWGGGQIWTTTAAGLPTVLWVRDGETSYAYGLVGGP